VARITYFDALGEQGFVTSFYDAATLHVTKSTSTSATMKDAAGARVVFTGTDIVFDGDTPTAGTISTINLYDSTGTLLTKVTDVGLAATDLFAQYQTLGLLGVELALIGGKDIITGSSLGDFIIGQGGNDKEYGGDGNDLISGGDQNDLIYGGNGDDQMNGGKGVDMMTGGAGADNFIYLAKDGSDTITDFTDTGAKALRDHIQISQAQYHSMTSTQVGADVDLAFNAHDHLILQGFDLASLDKSDFILG
jgi:Ca2+-binding RTX toxin-like protein